ncbi:MAG: efflux RND transporter periplasmic adaptor subunit [Acidobacteriaceae bacterium]|nr:efflux RND transporter periplasmic adaptor subunit [Acidobacteriaceae bacterium]MBV9778980.1 efflux RND transporter periplasmic adaptor subunit [Acidobacteriaceae bacterium]
MSLSRVVQFTELIVTVAVAFGLSACESASKAQSHMAFPPPPVSVMEVQAQDVPIYGQYAAQTFARDLVEVRGRVDGYIEKRLFQVGADVQAGQTLYVLDTRPYAADVDKAKADLAQSEANLEFAKKQVALIQAEANLAQAKANFVKAQQDVDRLQPLVSQEAAAKQDLDNALAALDANKANVAALTANVEQTRLQTRTTIDSAAAQVASNKALLRTAELNLGYATITAPIAGRIGDSLIEVGGLVSKTAPQPLTTIVPLDPIWVRFKVSEAEYLAYQKSKDVRNSVALPIHLILADDSVFPHEGQIRNAVNQVDLKTGTLEIQGTFPNPEHTILPGQFGRVRLRMREAKNVIIVPQRAVQELQSMQSVFTVGPDNKAQLRNIVTADRVGDGWIVTQGLKPGDKVIVEGVQKVRPGAPVQPAPYKAHNSATRPVQG